MSFVLVFKGIDTKNGKIKDGVSYRCEIFHNYGSVGNS